MTSMRPDERKLVNLGTHSSREDALAAVRSYKIAHEMEVGT
jgi:hypothetical protein